MANIESEQGSRIPVTLTSRIDGHEVQDTADGFIETKEGSKDGNLLIKFADGEFIIAQLFTVVNEIFMIKVITKTTKFKNDSDIVSMTTSNFQAVQDFLGT